MRFRRRNDEDMGWEDMDDDDDLAKCHQNRYGTPAAAISSLISGHVRYRRGTVTSDRCGDTEANIDFTEDHEEYRRSCVPIDFYVFFVILLFTTWRQLSSSWTVPYSL